jgi:hypothetical protein
MDQLRALAYMDIMLNKDSRPTAPAAQDGQDSMPPDPASGGEPGGPDGSGPDGSGPDGSGPDDRGGGGSGPCDPNGPGTPPTASVLPAGFAGHLHLTTPPTTLLNLAERPGEIAGLGPVDPALARDLAGAAALNPKTRYCLTVNR